MRKYQSLVAWQRAHRGAKLTLRVTDAEDHPRHRRLFDQLRRAAISVEANVVEGYALSTPAQFRRHLRIAKGSAAEAECLVRLAAEVQYLPQSKAEELESIFGATMQALHGLIRRPLAAKKDN